MPATQTAKQQDDSSPTFESVWASLIKDRELLKKTAREWWEYREQREKDDREWIEHREQQEDWDLEREGKYWAQQEAKENWRLFQSVKETDKKIKILNKCLGEISRYILMPYLTEKFRELGFVFTKACPRSSIEDKKNNLFIYTDIILENSNKVMVVEVKSKPTADDITDHIERMEKLRIHADMINDKRKYLGAIAGMVMSGSEKTFAFKNGFYVIEPAGGEPSLASARSAEGSGETFNITPPSGKPKEW